MSNRYTTDNIGEIGYRDIFFDANILIYLFWPTGRGQRVLEDRYATIYGEILRRELSLYVNYIVLSEVVNRTLRISWEEYLDVELLKKDKLTFKNYRNSEDGKEAQEEIATIIKEIVFNNFEVVEDSFTKEDIEGFLEVDTLDFSDKAILSTCVDNDFVLLTHDRDYSNSKIDILTCNKHILN